MLLGSTAIAAPLQRMLQLPQHIVGLPTAQMRQNLIPVSSIEDGYHG